jgi:hypothetical protein
LTYAAGALADLPRRSVFELSAFTFDHPLDLREVLLGALE